jgi:FixJ family two-component response regulator
MKTYKAFVVDDDAHVRDLLVECLRFSDFDAVGYDTAERLLNEVSLADFSPEGLPDLIIVDLQLQLGKMQGLELIGKLAELNIPSEVIAISGNHPNADLVEAVKIGAGAMVPKPFDDIIYLMKKMEHLAQIGMKRRLKLNGRDRTRQQRPVFLSYCDDDVRLATGLRRNIESRDIDVWYAPSTLSVGDEWRPIIEAGIDQASVFIALITDNYVNSPVCFAELLRFYRRTETSTELRPLLLPVLAGLSEHGVKHYLIRPILDRYQHIDLSVRFIDALTAILGRINLQILQMQRAKMTRKNHAASAPTKHKVRGSAV